MPEEPKKSMLERAKEIRRPAIIEHDPVEWMDVSLAWLRGELTQGQIGRATGQPMSAASVIYRIAHGLKEAYRLGRLVEKK